MLSVITATGGGTADAPGLPWPAAGPVASCPRRSRRDGSHCLGAGSRSCTVGDRPGSGTCVVDDLSPRLRRGAVAGNVRGVAAAARLPDGPAWPIAGTVPGGGGARWLRTAGHSVE